MLILRATVSFLVLPGLFAGLVPALIVGAAAPNHRTLPIGVALLAAGLALLLWCVRDFFVAGRGTLAPWDPPRHLVVVGLYRFVRNPMYLAVLTVVAGWSVLYLSAWLAGYLMLLAAMFHRRVIRHEEPWLQRQFGPEWAAYSAATPRWLPRVRRQRD